MQLPADIAVTVCVAESLVATNAPSATMRLVPVPHVSDSVTLEPLTLPYSNVSAAGVAATDGKSSA